MANLFGESSSITIYYNKYDYTAGVQTYVRSFIFPTVGRGDRNEDFVKDSKSWIDLDKILREIIYGYRLEASYAWKHIENADLENLIDIYNGAQNIFIEFSTIPQRYEIKIEKFKRGLADGLSFKDSAEISFIGIRLIKSYPNPDEMIRIVKCFNPGLIY